MRSIRNIFIVLIVSLIILFLTANIWLTAMAGFLEVSDPLEKADAILVLGGGGGDRISEAAELYKRGFSGYLIISAGPLYAGVRVREIGAEVEARDAVYLGVPAEHIYLEKEALSTFENATLTLPLIKKHGFKKIIVVTSPYHTRRASLVFKKRYRKEGIKVIIHPAPHSKYAKYSKITWWTRHEDTQIVISEWMSLIYYFLRGYF